MLKQRNEMLKQQNENLDKLEANGENLYDLIDILMTKNLFHNYLHALYDLTNYKKLVKMKSIYISKETRHSLKKFPYNHYKLFPYLRYDDSYAVKDYKLQLFKDKWENMPYKVNELFLLFYTNDFMNNITNYLQQSYNSTNTYNCILAQDELDVTNNWTKHYWS